MTPDAFDFPRPASSRASARSGGFFAFHGPWAPGVRLFRKITFRSKALLVSACFFIPLALLVTAYLRNVQDSLDVASQERAGVAMLQLVEPCVIEAQKQRRLVMSGSAPAADVAAIEAARRPAEEMIVKKPEGIDVSAALVEVEKSQV